MSNKHQVLIYLYHLRYEESINQRDNLLFQRSNSYGKIGVDWVIGKLPFILKKGMIKQ